MTPVNAKFSKALQLFNNDKLAEAKKLLKALTNTDKRNADAWLLLGMTEARSGKFSNAETCFRTMLYLVPNSADAHYYLGAALEAQHLYVEAIAEYQATIRLQPKYAKAHYNLGNVYRVQGLLEKAEEHYRLALSANPHYFEALNNLGSVLKKQSKLEAAIDCFSEALRIKPGDAGILTNLGNTFHLLENYGEAKKYYLHALKMDSGLSEAVVGLSGVLFKNGEKEGALKLLAEARQRLPEDDSIIASEATLYEEDGQYDEAYQVLRPRLEGKSESVEIAVAFAKISRYLRRVEEAVELLEGLLGGQLEASDRMRICFVVGKLYDSLGEYDKAFKCFVEGNRLKPLKFDRSGLLGKFSRTAEVFSSAFLSSSPASGNASSKPVFVVGMPRSGTSLVEQILSSHPDVYGAGELMDIGMIAASLPQATGSKYAYPECMSGITQNALAEVAARYESKLERLAPAATRVIDKMPGNFLHLGLIELLFPNARIIHCLRNPLDTCLSCYFTDFLGYHPYAYDQADLGYYYCQYLELMRRWKKVISLPWYTVEYETLVNNQERISRELVDFCGLEWNERCLAFHKTKRLVKTASYDQVRKPMYRSSVGRAAHYREKLGDLVLELEHCGCLVASEACPEQQAS